MTFSRLLSLSALACFFGLNSAIKVFYGDKSAWETAVKNASMVASTEDFNSLPSNLDPTDSGFRSVASPTTLDNLTLRFDGYAFMLGGGNEGGAYISIDGSDRFLCSARAGQDCFLDFSQMSIVAFSMELAVDASYELGLDIETADGRTVASFTLNGNNVEFAGFFIDELLEEATSGVVFKCRTCSSSAQLPMNIDNIQYVQSTEEEDPTEEPEEQECRRQLLFTSSRCKD